MRLESRRVYQAKIEKNGCGNLWTTPVVICSRAETQKSLSLLRLGQCSGLEKRCGPLVFVTTSGDNAAATQSSANGGKPKPNDRSPKSRKSEAQPCYQQGCASWSANFHSGRFGRQMAPLETRSLRVRVPFCQPRPSFHQGQSLWRAHIGRSRSSSPSTVTIGQASSWSHATMGTKPGLSAVSE